MKSRVTDTRSSRAPTVGVLGGTFDPVHLGHLHAAEWSRKVFALRRVLLVPCAAPAHKERELSPPEHRIAMLRLAAAERPWLDVSEVELRRGGVSYTIDTMRELAAASPPATPMFILGMDALLEIATWHRHEELVSEFDLIGVDRPGRDLATAAKALGEEVTRRFVGVPCREGAGEEVSGAPPGSGGRIFHVSIPPLAVSASLVRGRAEAGASLDGLVPDPVAEYIQDKGLYLKEVDH